MQFLRRVAVALAAGYILMFYSELMFWARFRPRALWRAAAGRTDDSLVGRRLDWY